MLDEITVLVIWRMRHFITKFSGLLSTLKKPQVAIDQGSYLSYDEAMIRFIGRYSSIILASNKPIKEGYECMLIATPGHVHGYVYSFIKGRKREPLSSAIGT